VLFEAEWHQGVIGILAGRIKEKFHRPTIAFARGNAGELKGSGRSIPGLHLRDALDLVTKQAPALILKFGGHAMAAGLTIREDDLSRFEVLFESVVRGLIDPADLTRSLETDGPLEDSLYNLETARLLEREIWGQGFAAPVSSMTPSGSRTSASSRTSTSSCSCARATPASTPSSSTTQNRRDSPSMPPSASPSTSTTVQPGFS
jgi:single-stranded DNA-specific DHH superfamily exonuclease